MGAADGGGALWLGAHGQPLGHQGVRQRITDRTSQAFGKAVLPHSFHHCAATGFALEHPDRPRDAAALLGHAGPESLSAIMSCRAATSRSPGRKG